MGDNLDKKKIRVTYFFMRNPYMNFQNISIYGFKVIFYTQKSNNIKWPKIAKGHNSNKISLNWFKI